MLSVLKIQNIAIIESAEIEFSRGFNVLSGETGAGKSIIIDSINAVLESDVQKTLPPEIVTRRAGKDFGMQDYVD